MKEKYYDKTNKIFLNTSPKFNGEIIVDHLPLSNLIKKIFPNCKYYTLVTHDTNYHYTIKNFQLVIYDIKKGVLFGLATCFSLKNLGCIKITSLNFSIPEIKIPFLKY